MTGSAANMPGMAAASAKTSSYSRSASRSTGWVGWIFFAGIMMMMLGAFQAIQGLVALFNDKYYAVGPNGLLVSFDFTTWGWIHLILGLAAVAIGIGVLAGNIVARISGIVLAALSAIVNLAFIAAYPLWGVLVITLDVIVIYALAVHGEEMKDA